MLLSGPKFYFFKDNNSCLLRAGITQKRIRNDWYIKTEYKHVTIWPKSKLWAYVNAPSLHRPAAKIVIKTKEMWYKRERKAGCQLHPSPPPPTSLPTHTFWTDRPFLSRLTAFHWPWREHSGPHICLPGPRQGWLLHPDPADHTNHPQLMWTIRRSLTVSITAHLFSEASPLAQW